NKPLGSEVANCSRFLAAQIEALPKLEAIVALGRIAHDSLLRLHGLRLARHHFAHCAEHELPGGTLLLDSYHCSRQNTRTGRLTAQMFAEVFQHAKTRRAQMSSQMRP